MDKKRIDRNLNDLHVEDHLTRLRLKDWMNDERDRQGVTNRELAARLGHNHGWAYGILNTSMWRLASVQRMVRCLGYTLCIDVNIPNIIVEARTDMSLAEIYANNPDPDKREEAARIDLGDLARRYREALKLTSPALGRRLDQEGEVVRSFENGDKPFYLLVTAQRHFRALGGALRLAIEPPGSGGTCFEVPQGRWPSADGGEVNIVEGDDRTLVWNSLTPLAVVSFSRQSWQEWMHSAVR